MPLEFDELNLLIEEACEKVRVEIIKANRLGTLEVVLSKYNIDSDISSEGKTRTGNTILVLGALNISKDDLSNLFKKFKLESRNFEFVEYEEVTNFNFAKLIGNTKYTDVFIGPVPHKAMNIGGNSSVIEYLRSSSDIPARLTEMKDASGELKITKKTFKKALEECELLNLDY